MDNNLLKIVFASLAITISTYLISPNKKFSWKNLLVCSSIVFLVYNILFNLDNSIFKHYQEGLGFGLGGRLTGEGFQNQPDYIGINKDISADFLTSTSSEYIKMLLKDASGDDSRKIIEQNRKDIIENNKITIGEENQINANINRLCSDIGFQSTAGYNNTDECAKNLRVMLDTRLNKLDVLKERLNNTENNNLDANELNLLIKFINSYLLLNNVDDLIEIGQTKGQKYALYNYIDYYINSFLLQEKRFLFILSAVLNSTPESVFMLYKNSMAKIFQDNQYLEREVENICNNAKPEVKGSCYSTFNKYISYTHRDLSAFIITSMLTYNTTIDMFKTMFQDVLDTKEKWQKHVRLYNININWLFNQKLVLNNLKKIYYKNATEESWNKFEKYIKSNDFVEYLNSNSNIFLENIINKELDNNNPNVKYFYFYYINFFAEKFMNVTKDDTETQERKLEELRIKNRKLYGIDTDKYGCIKGEKYCADSSVGDINGKCISGQAECTKKFTGEIYNGSDVKLASSSGNKTNSNRPKSIEDIIAEDESNSANLGLLNSDVWLKAKNCQFYQYVLRKDILGGDIKEKDTDISNNPIVSTAKYYKIFTIQKDKNGNKIDSSANTFYLKETDFKDWYMNNPPGVKNCILCVFNNIYILNYNHNENNTFTDKNKNVIDLNNEVDIYNNNNPNNKILPTHKLIMLLKYVTKGTNTSKSLLVPFKSIVDYYEWIKISKNFNIITNCNIESNVEGIKSGNPPTLEEANKLIKKIKEEEIRIARDTKDDKDTRDGKDTRDTRDDKDTRDTRDGKDVRDTRDGKDTRDTRDSKVIRDSKDTRDDRSKKLADDAKKAVANRDRIEREVRERESIRRESSEKELKRRGRGEKDIDSELIKQMSKQFADSIELDILEKEKQRQLQARDGPQGYVYLPPKHWMLPQQRHQVCKKEKRCPVCPAYTENNPVNLMSSDMWNTDLLSISNATPKIVKKSTKCKK